MLERALPRCHLFEFGDLDIPAVFHDLMTDILGHIAKMGLYDAIVPIINEVMQKQHCSTIIDICTGSGEPAMLLREKLENEFNCSINLILTDKFPNQDKAKKLNALHDVIYHQESVDATALPSELKGLRTLFASLHHFKPEQVQAILQNAVDNNQPIAALEFTERSWTRALFMIPGTLHVLAITPFIKPFSLSRLFWTYLVPVMPAIYFWDGLVSNLRTYSAGELKEIVSHLHDNHFSWEINTIPSALRPVNVTYLIGQPKQEEEAPEIEKVKKSEKPNKVKRTTQLPIPISVAMGILSGLLAYISTYDMNIALGVGAFTMLITWIAESKFPQYGRLFQFSPAKEAMALVENKPSYSM